MGIMHAALVASCKSSCLHTPYEETQKSNLQAIGAAIAIDNALPAFATFRNVPQSLLQARPLGVITVPFKPFIQFVIARSISFE